MDNEQFNLTSETFPSERYEVIKEIGRGVSGVVYLCRDKVLIKEAAVKTLRSLTVDQLVSFQQEARSTSSMSHENIVKVLDFGVTAGGVPYMVMEVFDGIDLEQHLKRSGRLPVSTAVDIFTRVADALAYAHEMQIYHRDLKPSNIILNLSAKDAQVKLIDFGVGKVKQENAEPAVYQGVTIAGTPGYMSCDQVKGIPYDERSEVYALGCVLFEALTGRTPFVGDTALDIFYQHANVEAPSLFDATGERFSQSIERLVTRCLAKEPDERFQSMHELAQALRTISTEGRFQPGQTTIMWTPATKRVKPIFTYGFMALLLPAVAGAVWAWISLQPHESESEPVRKISKPEPVIGLSDMFAHQEEAFTGGSTEHDGQVKALGVWKIEDFKKLATRKDVTSVLFNEVVVDPKGFQYLSTMPLHTLSLDKTELTDSDLAPIAKMQSLRCLYIAKNNLTDASLPYLTALKNVTHINVSGNQFTPQGIAKLFSMPSMRSIDLGNLPFKSTNWKELARPGTKIESVTVSNTALLKGDISYLKKLPFKRIFAGYCDLNDDDLKEIAKLKLHVLDLRMNEDLTDQGLAYLQGMSGLKELTIFHCPKVTAGGLEQLRKSLPGLHITDHD